MRPPPAWSGRMRGTRGLGVSKLLDILSFVGATYQVARHSM